MNFSLSIICCLVFAESTSRSFPSWYREVPHCYGNICPMDTVRCRKLLRPTDYGTLCKTVTCLDGFGNMIKEYYFENPVTLKLNSRAESISYSDVGENPFTPEYNEIADLMDWNNSR